MDGQMNTLSDVQTNMPNLSVPFTSRYLDALYEIKFKLAMKKIEGAIFIKKQEFARMIEEEASKDQKVMDAIDELFKPLNIFNKTPDLPEPLKVPSEIADKAFENDIMSVSDMEKMIDKEIKEEEGKQVGMQRVLAKPGFASNNTSSESNIN